MRAHRSAVRQLPLFAAFVPGVTMQTTGFPDVTPMTGLYERGRLAVALRDARSRTWALYGHLDLDSIAVPCIATVNPPLWELAHLAWFQEFWCLRGGAGAPGGGLAPSRLADADAMFNSSTVPHDSRWRIRYPSPARVRSYMERTLEETVESVAKVEKSSLYFPALALVHEDMHGEAFLMTLQHLGLPRPAIDALEPPRSLARGGDADFAGGTFTLGARAGAPGFVFDNERGAHEVALAPFSIANQPVTQGEFAAFVEEGGYGNDEWWTPEGLAWRAGSHRTTPVYWRRGGEGWEQRRFDRWEPLENDAPMVHVNHHEASAWCRWAGRRLPTEAEWEFAARGGGRDRGFPWGDAAPEGAPGLDLRHWGPSSAFSEPHPGGNGLRQMIGGVWEWTASRFTPYPGFAPDPYRDYSEPWFHSHYVLRGGSFATRSRLANARYRNFYLPHRDDCFAGFRSCAL